MFRMFGAAGKYPCAWCTVSLCSIDKLPEDVPLSESMKRPPIINMEGSQTDKSWQKKGTKNVFSITSNFEDRRQKILIVPPTL